MAGGGSHGGGPHYRQDIRPRNPLWPKRTPLMVLKSMQSNWRGSTLTHLTMLGVLGVYFTDWKVIAGYIPIYNGKFKEE